MTIDEAIVHAREVASRMFDDRVHCIKCAEEHEQLAKWLEELKQYRAIGKVSTCQNAVEVCRAMIERGIEPENIEAYIAFEDACVKKGFTIKGLLEAGEKQVPKKPITYLGTNRADCPICLNTVRGIDKPFGDYCSKCGCRLDWSDEE